MVVAGPLTSQKWSPEVSGLQLVQNAIMNILGLGIKSVPEAVMKPHVLSVLTLPCTYTHTQTHTHFHCTVLTAGRRFDLERLLAAT